MTAKTTNLLYWIFTILFAGLMIFTAVPNALNTKKKKKVIHGMLGYPVYFIPFIGFAKIIGSIVILIPGLKKIKEWAYAGLTFTLVFAFISHSCVDKNIGYMIMPLVFLGILMTSYIYGKKIRNNG